MNQIANSVEEETLIEDFQNAVELYNSLDIEDYNHEKIQFHFKACLLKFGFELIVDQNIKSLFEIGDIIILAESEPEDLYLVWNPEYNVDDLRMLFDKEMILNNKEADLKLEIIRKLK